MNARRHEGKLRLQFNLLEAHLVLRALRALVENYKAAPADLDPATADVWYSNRGCRSASMSAEETRDWLDALHQIKGARTQRLQEWADALAQPRASAHRLRIDLHDAELLIASLNDYRLMTAARHQIGQAEMDARDEEAGLKLPPGQRVALMEIHLLAWLMEEVLALLESDGAPPQPPAP